jgi:hypothetical protein
VSSSGALILVGTPIGNLGDLTPRAVEALRPRIVELVDGIVVGSRALEVAEEGPEALRDYVSSLREALDEEPEGEPRGDSVVVAAHVAGLVHQRGDVGLPRRHVHLAQREAGE